MNYLKQLQSNTKSCFIQLHTRLQKLPETPDQGIFVIAMNMCTHARCLQIIKGLIDLRPGL